jgi:hypothetical protein
VNAGTKDAALAGPVYSEYHQSFDMINESLHCQAHSSQPFVQPIFGESFET